MQNGNRHTDQENQSSRPKDLHGMYNDVNPFHLSHPGSGPYGRQPSEHPGVTSDMLDEVSFTLQELNKAVQNVNYVIDTIQELDLLSLFKSLSGSEAQHILKRIDLQQISEILQSPLVRELLTDPKILSIFMPTSNSSSTSDETQTSGKN